MTVLVAIGFAINLCYFAAAALSIWGLLRGFDWLAGTKFSSVAGEMKNDPRALSIYFGLRFVGVCILGASLVPGGL